MIEWLGIDHLFELSGMEAVAGFFTPLVIFAVFLVAQLILPARRVPGYVIDQQTGEPRQYRLNGLLVFLIALAAWAIAPEFTDFERDWFYRSTIYAVVGGTVFTAIFAAVAVLTQPKTEPMNVLAELWFGRVQGAFDLQQPLRREDVFLCRRRDDAVAQRPVRGLVPL